MEFELIENGFARLQECLSSVYASNPVAPLKAIKDAFEARFHRPEERYFSEDDRTLLFARLT